MRNNLDDLFLMHMSKCFYSSYSSLRYLFHFNTKSCSPGWETVFINPSDLFLIHHHNLSRCHQICSDPGFFTDRSNTEKSIDHDSDRRQFHSGKKLPATGLEFQPQMRSMWNILKLPYLGGWEGCDHNLHLGNLPFSSPYCCGNCMLWLMSNILGDPYGWVGWAATKCSCIESTFAKFPIFSTLLLRPTTSPR